MRVNKKNGVYDRDVVAKLEALAHHGKHLWDKAAVSIRAFEKELGSPSVASFNSGTVQSLWVVREIVRCVAVMRATAGVHVAVEGLLRHTGDVHGVSPGIKTLRSILGDDSADGFHSCVEEKVNSILENELTSLPDQVKANLRTLSASNRDYYSPEGLTCEGRRMLKEMWKQFNPLKTGKASTCKAHGSTCALNP